MDSASSPPATSIRPECGTRLTNGQLQATLVGHADHVEQQGVLPARRHRKTVSRSCTIWRSIAPVGPMSDVAPESPLAAVAVAPLRAKSEMARSAKFAPLWSGQNARLSREFPAAGLTRQLAEETLEQLNFLDIMASPEVLAQAAALATVGSRRVSR